MDGIISLPDTSFKQSARYALRIRCAVCGDGRPFSRWFSMAAKCSACGFHYKREPGYFIGAMYVSYVMCVAMMMPLVLYCMLSGVPLIFRYSRGL